MKKILVSTALCTMAVLLCFLCSCGIGNKSKLEFAESMLGDYVVAGRGKNTDTDLVIPAEFAGKAVTAIGEGAFIKGFTSEDSQSLRTVTLPDSITRIGASAFANNNELTSINIPAAVTTIGEGAFLGCEALTSIVIPEGVETIKSNTFKGCKALTSVTLPSTLKEIEDYAFSYCEALTTIQLPDGLVELGDRVFYGCGALTGEINMPESVTELGSGVFANTASGLVVKVSYDSEPPKGWEPDWFVAMAGEALNISEAYYENVVVPNQTKIVELRDSLENQKAVYASLGEQIEAKTKERQNLADQNNMYNSETLAKQINQLQKDISDLKLEQSRVSSKITELEEQIANCKTTNKLN